MQQKFGLSWQLLSRRKCCRCASVVSEWAKSQEGDSALGLDVDSWGGLTGEVTGLGGAGSHKRRRGCVCVCVC